MTPFNSKLLNKGRKQAYVYFYASYCDKIPQIHDSDIFQSKIQIPDKNNLFATLITHLFNIQTIEYSIQEIEQIRIRKFSKLSPTPASV